MKKVREVAKPMTSDEPDILEKFGPYELVARFVDGKHRGILWRSGEKLISVTAASNVEAKMLIEAHFYETHLEQARGRGESAPAAEEMATSLEFIWPHLNPTQKKMLQAQYEAAGRRMNSVQLAKVAGYKSAHAASLFYGQAGFMLFSESPRLLPADPQTGEPVYSFALSVGVGDEAYRSGQDWVWEMRPEVARGLEMAGLTSA